MNPTPESSTRSRPLRIAWIGGGPSESGGVGTVSLLLMRGLLEQGHHVEFFAIGEDAAVPERIAAFANLSVVPIETGWRWGRWYSRTRLRAFVSGMIARMAAHRRMVRRLVERHAQQPFDGVVQMSQTELFTLRRHLHALPPLVLFPCVHAAGELRWHRREQAYARRSEGWLINRFARLMLMYRARIQRRDYRFPRLVIGMSRRFNELVRQDYGIEPARQAVLYHPIDPPPRPHVRAPRPHRPADRCGCSSSPGSACVRASSRSSRSATAWTTSPARSSCT